MLQYLNELSDRICNFIYTVFFDDDDDDHWNGGFKVALQ